MQVPKELYRLQKRKDINENTTTSSLTSISLSSLSSSIGSSSPSANAYGVSSNGCVVCSSTPECPRCGPNEQCAMTTQTCLECPTTYCLNVSESINSTVSKSTLSSAEIGGIAGGLSGFVFILLMGGVYYLIRKYAKRVNVDYELGINEEMKGLAGAFDLDEDEENENYGGNLKGTRNDKRRIQFHDPEKRMSQNSLATMTNSVLTKASNVLNIVYVPGVTSNRPIKTTFGGNRRLTRKPAESIYSKGMSIYSKETYFSDLEDASFHGGNVAMRGAHLRLVEIKQDNYDFDDDEDSGHVRFANSDEEIEENEEDTDSNFRIDINLRLPERRNFNDYIMEEEEEEEEEEEGGGEEKEKDRGINVLYNDVDLLDDGYNAADEENYHEDAEDIQLNIGVLQPSGSSNNRAMPIRYAALIEKKEKTKLDPFIDPHDDIDENSFSDSFSDSDEENIELLLQNNGSVPGNGNNPFLSSHD